jgi:hypothetical protein
MKATALNTYYPVRWYDNFVSLLFGWIYRLGRKVIFGHQDPKSDFFRGRRGIFMKSMQYKKGKIRLRWLSRGDQYVLQLKTIYNCDQEMAHVTGDKESKVYINYHLQSLWKDETMFASRQSKKDPDLSIATE